MRVLHPSVGDAVVELKVCKQDQLTETLVGLRANERVYEVMFRMMMMMMMVMMLSS